MSTFAKLAAVTLLVLFGIVGTNLFKPSTAPAAQAPQATKGSHPIFAIVDVQLFDGDKLWPKASVLVRDGLIAGVFETDRELPANAQRISGLGKMLLPGLIDSHTHNWADARRDALRFGVTTELEMLGDSALFATQRTQRESRKFTDQADLYSAGSAVTVERGHGTQFLAVPALDASANAAEVAGFVAARAAEGSDYIKLIVEDLSAYSSENRLPTLNPAQSQAAIEASHAASKLAVVHASTLESATRVLEQGADGLVHIFHDATLESKFTTLAKNRNSFVIPTLSVYRGNAQHIQQLRGYEDVEESLSTEQRSQLESKFSLLKPSTYAVAKANVTALHRAGVTLLAGTDAGNPGTAHGISLHGELQLLVEAGLSPLQALRAATSLPALRFGLRDRGRIAVGLRGDLLLINGNALQEITATRAIETVWKNGFAIDRGLSQDSSTPVPLLAAGVLAQFEQAGALPAWRISTDKMANGSSQAEYSLILDGTGGNNSEGFARIRGELRADFAYPWAGLSYSPNGFRAANASQIKRICFDARRATPSADRDFRLSILSGEPLRQIPAAIEFRLSDQWQTYCFDTQQFPDADFAHLRALMWGVGMPEGEFSFDLDSVLLE